MYVKHLEKEKEGNHLLQLLLFFFNLLQLLIRGYIEVVTGLVGNELNTELSSFCHVKIPKCKLKLN